MALLLGATACAHGGRAPESSTAAPPSAIAAVSRTAAPQTTPATVATPTVSPTPETRAAIAAPTPLPPSPKPTGPQILALSATPQVVHAGDVVVWDVRTSPDVVAVTAHAPMYEIPLERRSSGRFGLSFQIPAGVPSLFHGDYTLQVVARTTAGATASRSLVLSFR